MDPSSSSQPKPMPGQQPQSQATRKLGTTTAEPKTPPTGIDVTIPLSPTEVIDINDYSSDPLTTILPRQTMPFLGRTPYVPATCHLRSMYELNKDLEVKKDSILKVAQEIVQNEERLPSVPLPKEARDIAEDLLTKLDKVLVGIPYLDNTMEQIGYHLDPVKFDDFKLMLSKYVQRAREKLQGPLPVPTWGIDNYALDVWSASNFEMLSVLYRDEVETFLAYLYHNGVLFPPKASKGKKVESPRIQQYKEGDIHLYSSISEPPKATTHAAKGFQEMKKVKIQRQFEPRIADTSYTVQPSHISGSRRISELFKEPQFLHQSSAPRSQSINVTQGDPEDSSDGDSTPFRPPSRPTNPPSNPFRRRGNQGNGGGDGDSEPSEPEGGGRPIRRRNMTPLVRGNQGQGINEKETQFDNKLKPEIIPRWDGDPDTIAKWINKVNNLAERSPKIYNQLGEIVPTRLEKEADAWFWSLPLDHRREITQNWGTLRTAIGSYYMNRSWLDKQKSRANKAHYREPGHSTETPTAYFIRKSDLLNLVYSYSDAEIMMEIMEGAPRFWATVLDPHRCKDLVEFSAAIKYHEDVLSHSIGTQDSSIERRLRNLEQTLKGSGPQTAKFNPRFRARTNLIGQTPLLGKPPFPKDDSTVSKGASPEKKGARPCRHCGSAKHWDNECKHAKKGARKVRANFVNPEPEYLQAMEEYEEAYLNASSEEEDFNLEEENSTHQEEENNSNQDFHEALQVQAVSEPQSSPNAVSMKIQSSLGGSKSLGRKIDETLTRKRTLLKRVFKVSNFMGNICKAVAQEVLSLPKLMARPPGCSFLGAQATATEAWLGSYGINKTRVVIDSGADITLISHLFLSKMEDPPRIKVGQKINLIQVTGSSSISGYIILPVYFDTNGGPIEIVVEAYVVKGMTTPFILGNDFADQYAISIIRSDEGAILHFGNSGRTIKVQNSLGSSLTTGTGEVFTISTTEKSSKTPFALKKNDNSVRAETSIIIPP